MQQNYFTAYNRPPEHREPRMTAAELARRTGVRASILCYHLKKPEAPGFIKVRNRKYYLKSQLLTWYEKMKPQLRNTPCR